MEVGEKDIPVINNIFVFCKGANVRPNCLTYGYLGSLDITGRFPPNCFCVTQWHNKEHNIGCNSLPTNEPHKIYESYENISVWIILALAQMFHL